MATESCFLATDHDADIEEAIDHGQVVCMACRSYGGSTHVKVDKTAPARPEPEFEWVKLDDEHKVGDLYKGDRFMLRRRGMADLPVEVVNRSEVSGYPGQFVLTLRAENGDEIKERMARSKRIPGILRKRETAASRARTELASAVLDVHQRAFGAEARYVKIGSEFIEALKARSYDVSDLVKWKADKAIIEQTEARWWGRVGRLYADEKFDGSILDALAAVMDDAKMRLIEYEIGDTACDMTSRVSARCEWEGMRAFVRSVEARYALRQRKAE